MDFQAARFWMMNFKEQAVFAENTQAVTHSPAFLSYDERKSILDRYEIRKPEDWQDIFWNRRKSIFKPGRSI